MKYIYVWVVGTLKPMRIKDILTKKPVFCRTPALYDRSMTHNDIKFDKESKTIIVVDKSLHSLKHFHKYTRTLLIFLSKKISLVNHHLIKTTILQIFFQDEYFWHMWIVIRMIFTWIDDLLDWGWTVWKCSLNWIHPNKRYVSMNEFFCLFVF